MAGGIITTGLDYENKALSGFVRASSDQEQIDMANKKLKAERKAQQATLGAEGAVVGGMAGYAGATSAAFAGTATEGGAVVGGTELGAELGSLGGPIGAVFGAGLGFLFSRLF
jgi:hypothetical protein